MGRLIKHTLKHCAIHIVLWQGECTSVQPHRVTTVLTYLCKTDCCICQNDCGSQWYPLLWTFGTEKKKKKTIYLLIYSFKSDLGN